MSASSHLRFALPPAQGQNLCFTCHTEKKEEFLSKRFGHPPAALNCSNCHDPHTSPNPLRLNNSVPGLCFGCHPEKRDHIRSVKTEHDAYKIEKKCLNCHDPHYTNFPKQLKAAPADLCLSCHNKELDTPTGKIMNMKKWLEGNRDWHGPIRQKDCPGCHNPHGTDNMRILKRPYPKEFYTPFAEGKYGLCFGCHEKTLVFDRFTTTLTNFRNGDENLHFRHVNQSVKGRTCRACHEVHASNNPKHIRDSRTLRQLRAEEGLLRHARSRYGFPNPAEALNNVALLYIRLGIKSGEPALFELAANSLEESRRLEPQSYAVLNNLANAYFELGRFDEAAAAYAEIIRVMPQRPQPRFNLALVYERQGKFDSAYREYGMALVLKPDWSLPKDRLERLRKKAPVPREVDHSIKIRH